MKHKEVTVSIFYVWIAIIALYGLTRVFQLKWNSTTSMPQRLWLTNVGNKNLKVHDYVIFKFHDFRMTDPNDFEYVVKQIGGVAGDRIIVKDSNNFAETYSNSAKFVFVLPDGIYPTFNVLSGHKFKPLTTNDMIIPNGCYFVHGQHHPSFDSRYKEFGFVCESQIFGKAYPLI